jgi:hypothetical protein
MPAEAAVPAEPALPAEPPMPAEPQVPLVSNEAMDAEPGPAAPDPSSAMEPPEASPVEEPKPDVAPEPPDRAGSVTPAVQHVNMDIRILSPGDNGPVHQESFTNGGSSGDDAGSQMPSGGAPGFDWTWNWTWSETCDGAARSAAWTWNWTWCGDLHLPDMLGAQLVSDRGALEGVGDLELVAPSLDLGFPDDASRPIGSGDQRQRPSAAGGAAVEDDDSASRPTNGFERPGPLEAISRPFMPVTAPAPDPQPREAVSRRREGPGRFPDSSAPLLPVAAFAAAGPSGGTAGSPAAIALLAALILLGPSLLRGFLADRAPLRPSHQSSRLERPG